MSKIEYNFRMGTKEYSVQLEAQIRDDGTSVFSADDLLREQWRRNKGISKAAWQAFRIFFYDLFSNGTVTNPIFLGNKQMIAG